MNDSSHGRPAVRLISTATWLNTPLFNVTGTVMKLLPDTTANVASTVSVDNDCVMKNDHPCVDPGDPTSGSASIWQIVCTSFETGGT